MQGYILITGSDRSLILGDDGVRYKFSSLEWQSDDVQPEAGMRVDFEVRGSDAADIYPIPGASAMAPIEPSPASSTMGGASPAQPPAAPSADERFKAMLGRMHNQLNVRYGPIREVVGNYGVIGAGVALVAVGSLIGFDIFEAIVDLLAAVGIILGAAIAAVGIFMLGKEEGWWGKDDEPDGRAGSAAAPAGGVSNTSAESRGIEGQPSEDTELAEAARASRRMKTCPHCVGRILYAAIKCRYCGSDVPPEADSL